MEQVDEAELQQMRAEVRRHLDKLPAILEAKVPREAVAGSASDPIEPRVRRFAELAPHFSITPTELACWLTYPEQDIPRVREVLDSLVSEGKVKVREGHYEPIYSRA
jgi:hypothetical protein